MHDDHEKPDAAGAPDGRPATVLAATDQPVPLVVREVEDDRVPEGMTCLGTFLDGMLVARCAVPPEAVEFFAEQKLFDEPRQLVLAAREEEPGLRCELYALVPMPEREMPVSEEEPEEPWLSSVPSYEEALARAQEDEEDELDDEELDDDDLDDDDLDDDDEADEDDDAADDVLAALHGAHADGRPMAAVLLGQIVRFQRDRKHPDSLPLETVDVLARIVSGRVVEVVDKVLEDLLGS
ncbi:MAG: hypothetical protein IPJ11_03810 [Gemmatimonadetes bacterium]|nr:hypothetical protein [Gemmatimonadota bacterium]